MEFEFYFGLVHGSRGCHMDSKKATLPDAQWSKKSFHSIESLSLYLLKGDIPVRTVLDIRQALESGRPYKDSMDVFIEDAQTMGLI